MAQILAIAGLIAAAIGSLGFVIAANRVMLIANVLVLLIGLYNRRKNSVEQIAG